jgi:hypothetical protein
LHWPFSQIAVYHHFVLPFTWGGFMRKVTLLLAALAVAAAPAIADAKSKSKKRAAAKPAAAAKVDANEPGRRLVGQAFYQLIVPFESMGKASATQQQAAAKPAKAKKAKRAGKKAKKAA